MSICLNEITWQAIAAVATFAAVVVALIPIWRDRRRQKAHARGLRFRLCSKLTLLCPSLGRVVQRGHADFPTAILSKDEFSDVVQSIGGMLQESSVLETDEQDALGMAFGNLQMTAVLYESRELTEDDAKNVLALINTAISVMEKHGLLHSTVEVPWDNDGETQHGQAG